MPRHASTVVVVREGARDLEVFCVLRHARSSFLGGAVVFPGGKVDPSDGAEIWATQATSVHPRTEALAAPFSMGPQAAPNPDALRVSAASAASTGAHSPSPPPVTARALAVAACRESLEEARLLPVDGGPFGHEEVDALHRALSAAPGELAAALSRVGRRLALDALVPWARWVTPEAESRRFDARFFLLSAPPGQEGRHDDHETTMSFWAAPAAVLDRAARGEIFLAPPTTRTLELLATVRDVAGARALAAEQSLLPVCPQFIAAAPAFLALPGDPAHPVRERRVAGPTRFVLRDGRFVSEEAPSGGAPPPGGAA